VQEGGLQPPPPPLSGIDGERENEAATMLKEHRQKIKITFAIRRLVVFIVDYILIGQVKLITSPQKTAENFPFY
jgi:hypothetical protein